MNKLWDLETDLPRMLKSVTLTVSVKALPALTEFISSHTAANGQEPPGSGPAFYLRVEDSMGWGVYRLDRSPSLDLDFLRGAAELLGGPSAVAASFGQLLFERALGRR